MAKADAVLLYVQPGTVYGEARPTLLGSHALNVFNVEINPLEADSAEREQADSEGGRVTKPHVHNKRASFSFSTYLVGSGVAGTAPAWGALAQACGATVTTVSGTSNTYSLVSQNSAIGFCHLLVQIGPDRFYCDNARGTCEETYGGGLPTARWTFQGLESTPVTETILAPAYANTGLVRAVDAVNTPTFELGTSLAPVAREFSSFTYNWGNELQLRNNGGGSREVMIVTGLPTASVTIRDTGLSDYNNFSIAGDETEQRLRLVHGPIGTRISRVIPRCTLAPGTREAVNNETYQTHALNIMHDFNVRNYSTLICS
jgi:hypothetical protein